jgi:hypothetical protein
VRLTHGQAATGQWSAFLEPTRGAWAYLAGPGTGSGGYYYGGSSGTTLAGVLGTDAGVKIPDLGLLTTVAGLYVLLIGPVMFIVLARMRRRTLAWITIPAAAALFTASFAFIGARARTDVENASAVVIELREGGAYARTITLMGSAGGGDFELRAPDGWLPMGENLPNYGPRNQDTRPLTLGGPTTAALGPGEFQSVGAAGPLAGYGTPLRISATSDGATITGTVTNDLGVTLHQVTVMAHNTTTVIPTVGPHSQTPFTLADAQASGGRANPHPETGYWPLGNQSNNGYYSYSCTNCGGPPVPGARPPVAPPMPPMGADNAVNGPMWSAFVNDRPESLRSSGTVNVVGWTRELPSPVTVNGQAPRQGRTGLVARAPIRPQPLDSVGVRFDQVRGTHMGKRDPADDPVERFVVGPVYRVVLPAGVDPGSLVIEAPSQYHRIAVSSADGWKVTPEQGQPIHYRVDPADVVNGAVYLSVRVSDAVVQGPSDEPYESWRFRPAEVGERTTPATLAAETVR